MKRLLIHTHLGLGDLIDCNGLIRYIQKQKNDTVYVVAKSKTYDLIKYMFRDNKDICVCKINGIDEYKETNDLVNTLNANLLRIGHTYKVDEYWINTGKNCSEYFYESLGIPYNIRYDWFYVERDLVKENEVYLKMTKDADEYVFVHDAKDRGLDIRDDDIFKIYGKQVNIVRNDITENPFNFIKLFENSKQIHCMESSIKSIVDSYPLKNLYFHNFRGHPLGNNTKNLWNIVKYDYTKSDY